MVKAEFKTLADLLGKKVGSHKGNLRLSRNFVYGGYVVQEIVDHNGSIEYPFGIERRDTKTMYYALHFAIRVIDYRFKNG